MRGSPKEWRRPVIKDRIGVGKLERECCTSHPGTFPFFIYSSNADISWKMRGVRDAPRASWLGLSSYSVCAIACLPALDFCMVEIGSWMSAEKPYLKWYCQIRQAGIREIFDSRFRTRVFR